MTPAVLPHQYRRNSDAMRRVSVPALGVVAYAPDGEQAAKAVQRLRHHGGGPVKPIRFTGRDRFR